MKIIGYGNRLQAAGIWIVLGIASLVMLVALTSGFSPRESYSKDVLMHFDEEFLAQADSYQRSGLVTYFFSRLLTWLIYIGLIIFAWRFFVGNPHLNIWQAAGFVLLLLIILAVLTFPVDYYRGFVVEHRFGLSTQTFAAWFADYTKAGAVSLVFSAIPLIALYALTVYYPERWWIIGGVLFTLFMIAATYLSPLIIDPLFHRFEPLKDTGMRSQIETMAGMAGIEVDEVLVADASKRTTKVNAYFTGIGKTKRIVIYDNLLTRFSSEEALAVIAHEIGHWRHAHIPKNILMGAIGAFLTLFVFNFVVTATGLYADIRILPLALLFFSLVSFLSLPLNNAVSRHFERQADLETLRLTEDPSHQVALFENLARANLAGVEPHPYVRFMLYSHPPLIERIRAATVD